MLRHCRANTSAIWGLSLAKGLTDLLPVDTEPDRRRRRRATGVVHTVWVVDDPDACAAIAEAVAAQPVVIADGHHRYETSLAYRARARARPTATPARRRATLAYVVELVEDELTVRAIHRLVDGLPDGTDLVAALEPVVRGRSVAPPAGVPVTQAMAAGRGAVRRHARRRGAAAPPARGAGRRPRPRLGPPRRRPGRAARAHACASSTASTTCAGAVADGRRPVRRAAAPGDRGPDRGHGPRRRAHAAEDDVLPPQAPDGPGLPRPRLSDRRPRRGTVGRMDVAAALAVPARQPPGRHGHHPGRRHDPDVADHRRRRPPRAGWSCRAARRPTRSRHLRALPYAAICAFTDGFFGEWVQVEGPVDIVSLPDAMEPLVDYYRDISGEHPDWDDYRAAMERDRRVILRMTIERAGPTVVAAEAQAPSARAPGATSAAISRRWSRSCRSRTCR